MPAFNRGKELRSSWYTSRVQGLGFLLFILALAATASIASAQRPSHVTSTGDTRLRKSVTALSVSDRKDFVDAILALKRARSPYSSSLNYYDQFVQWHKDRYVCDPAAHLDTSTMPMVHAGPLFLPWHRELLLRFENALREVSGKPLTVPYWDWTDPESVNPDNPHSVFRDDFMGGSGSPLGGVRCNDRAVPQGRVDAQRASGGRFLDPFKNSLFDPEFGEREYVADEGRRRRGA